MRNLTIHLKTRLAAALLCFAVGFAALPAAAVYASDAEPETSAAGAEEDGGGEGGAQPENTPAASLEGLYQPNFDIEAQSAYILNKDTGIAIYEKNADTPVVAASLVKMMTCILAMEHLPDVDGTFITAEGWIYDELYGKNASTADIRKGETVSVRELLYAMLLPSANEAALMIAGHIGNGSTENFVYLMNEKARQLGCTNTTFADPNGLSTDNLTSARDMVLIVQEFMKYPLLVEISDNENYEIAQHEAHTAAYHILTTNKLIVTASPYYTSFPTAGEAIRAGKTGSLGEWQNFACYAEKDGMGFYSVILNTPNEADELAQSIQGAPRPALYETGRMLTWAFESFNIRGSLDTTQAIYEIRVKYSTDDDAVKLLPSSDLKTILPVDANDSVVQKTFDLPEYVEAPVRQGEVVGTVTLSLGGQVIGTADLIVAKDVDRNNTKYAMERLGEFVGTVYFKILIVAVILIVIGYIALAVYLHSRKQRRRTANPYLQNGKGRRR